MCWREICRNVFGGRKGTLSHTCSRTYGLELIARNNKIEAKKRIQEGYEKFANTTTFWPLTLSCLSCTTNSNYIFVFQQNSLYLSDLFLKRLPAANFCGFLEFIIARMSLFSLLTIMLSSSTSIALSPSSCSLVFLTLSLFLSRFYGISNDLFLLRPKERVYFRH